MMLLLAYPRINTFRGHTLYTRNVSRFPPTSAETWSWGFVMIEESLVISEEKVSLSAPSCHTSRFSANERRSFEGSPWLQGSQVVTHWSGHASH